MSEITECLQVSSAKIMILAVDECLKRYLNGINFYKVQKTTA